MKIVWHRDRFTERAGMIHVKCAVCERSMWFPPSKASRYKTCGGACAKDLSGRDRLSRKRPCEKCGKEFIPSKQQVASGNGRLCSQKCNTAGLEKTWTPEVKARAVATWKKTHMDRGIVKSGPDHPRWRGGRKAMIQRLVSQGKYREANHRRRLKTGEKIDPAEILKILERQNFKCVYCLKCVREKYDMDHVMPLALGGKHHISNIQILCPTCNRKKGKSHPVEYANKLGMLL